MSGESWKGIIHTCFYTCVLCRHVHSCHSRHKGKLDSGNTRFFSTNQWLCIKIWAHSTYHQLKYGYLSIDWLKCFCFRSILFWHGNMERFFSLNHCPLTNRYLIIRILELQFFLENIYNVNIPLAEMLFCLKVAKKRVHVYCFHGKHFTCWDLRGMLETDSFVQKDSKQTLPLHA